MSRITHFKQQPVNVEFWDYYILCHLNADVALVMQRWEYWDGTKDASNTHAEAINEALKKAGKAPTQDISYWVYKSQDELLWEILGIAGEKRLPKILKLLINDLKYIDCRNNPLEGWDRKKQYAFNADIVQEHVNYLGYIIAYFNLPIRHLRPVFYAIEALTRENVSIDHLNVEMVLERIARLKEDPKLPHFLKWDIEKFSNVFVKPPVCSFRTLSEWKTTKCGMHSDEEENAKRPNAECIPTNVGSNSIEDTYTTNIDDLHKEGTNTASLDAILSQLQQALKDNATLRAQLEGFTSLHIANGATPNLDSHRLYDTDQSINPTNEQALQTENAQLRVLLAQQQEDHDASTLPLGDHATFMGNGGNDLSAVEAPTGNAQASRNAQEAQVNGHSRTDSALAPAASQCGDSGMADSRAFSQPTSQVEPSTNTPPTPVGRNNTRPSQEEVLTQDKKPNKRASRRKVTPAIDDVLQKRIEKVYEYFDRLKQEVMEKPDARYRRTGTDTEAIIAWLDSHPTEEILREVYLKLWETPEDKRTGFSWKKNMWIHSVLKQYETLEMDIVAERNKQAKRHVVFTAPGAKSTFVPPPEEEDDMPFIKPSELYRKRG